MWHKEQLKEDHVFDECDFHEDPYAELRKVYQNYDPDRSEDMGPIERRVAMEMARLWPNVPRVGRDV